ncbi:response regulator [Thiorhodovibrio frisius]|nr:response regulator [Thiorhodovibrio frisius]
MSPKDIQRTLHEARVKQIELELQDKELQRAKAQISTMQARCLVCQKRALPSALSHSEKLFRAIFMTAPSSFLIHNKDSGEMLAANPTACVQYGYDSFEALKANHDRMWTKPPYSREDLLKWAAKTIQEGPQQFEWCYRHAEGKLQWEWVHLSALVMHGKTCILAISDDITREKQITTNLQASESLTRAIINASPMPLAIAYETGAVTYLNRAFTECFGYTLEDIPTWSDWRVKAFPDPDYRQRVVNMRREALQSVTNNGDSSKPGELMVCCKDGQRRTLTAFATPLKTTPEILYLNTFSDVTELNQAREEARQAAQIKSQFLANMSHEIRTPLSAMLGLAQLLEGEALSAEQHHQVQQMRTAGRSLNALVNDILDLSKLEAGQLRLTARTFSPVVLLAQVASLMGQQARAKGLAFQLDTPSGLAAWLRGDALRLEQILVNLVSNAVKFTERGEVCVKVSQEDIDTRTVRLRLDVQDTGIGISPEHLATLGTAFTQADESITRRFGGTGLGLAISKQLVEQMDGTLDVDSTLGVGSHFWFELPFERVSPEEAPAEKIKDTQQPSGPRLTGLHCLVADDCPMNREMVERALRREGARVTLVTDGQQALDWLHAHPQGVDALLMDIRMPVMDGLAATRALRRDFGLTDLPVIAFSAGVLTEHRQQAEEAGFSDFLAKPVDLEDLVSILRRWCATPAADASPPSSAPTQLPSNAPKTDFPDIPGLDTRRAARYFDNDWSRFLKSLASLTNDFHDAAQHTRDDLARGAVNAAAQRLHSLRGRAGYLGTQDLIQTAATLEQRLLEGRTDLEDLIDAFEEQLAALLTALKPWLPSKDEKVRILIVDDDPASVKMMGEALMPEYQCEFALSGAQALQRLKTAAAPALILLDLMMPEMDGYELCRSLQKDPRWQDIPIIFVTASQDIKNETQALQAGATDFIPKPIDPSVLRLRIDVHLLLRE